MPHRYTPFLTLLLLLSWESVLAAPRDENTATESAVTSARAPSLLTVLEKAVQESAAHIKPAVVQVKLEGYTATSGHTYTIAGGQLRPSSSGSSSTTLNGAVVSEDGYVVVSGQYDNENVEQVEVWIGKREVAGRFVGKDELLNMSIIEIDPQPALKSVLSLPEGKLQGGKFAVLFEAGREGWDYQAMLSLAMCRGEIPGNYTKYLLDQTSSRFKGSPVVTLNGRFAGFFSSKGEVLALADIREDLEKLIRKAAEGNGSQEDEKEEKGWLGASVLALNEDYVRLKSLPEHVVMVSHVVAESPAWQAGLRTGDLLVGVQGKPLRFSGGRARDLFSHHLRPRREKPFELTVLRDGKEATLHGVFAKKPESETLQADDLGVTVSDIGAGDGMALNLFQETGVRITEIKKGSPAAVSGSMNRTLLSKDDVITGIGEIPTPNVAAFKQALQEIRQRGDEVLLVQYWRGRTTGYAGLNLGLGENGKSEDKN